MKWRKTSEENSGARAFLLEREKLCVAASARFLCNRENRGHIWYLGESEDQIKALLLHNRRTLFPVFNGNVDVPVPGFLARLLGKIKIHAVQGLRQDAELLETLLEDRGYFASERIDYHLMSLDAEACKNINERKLLLNKKCPAGLILRKPLPSDEEDLFTLQSAYEKEEVLPANSEFNPAHSRLNLKRLMNSEQMLVAELDSRVVGKINTSAESFSRYQVGGVYVRPDCRGMGIALRMTVFFTESLMAQGKGITLFVKKRNAAAIKVYRKAGFSALADYRISYY